MADQLGQVVAQGRFAAGEDHVRHSQLPQFVDDAEPLFRRQRREVALAGVVAVGAVVVAAIGDCQVHAVRSAWTGAERHQRVQLEIVDRAGAIGTEQFIELAAECCQVTARLRAGDGIAGGDGGDTLLLCFVFQDEPRHGGCGWVEVHHAAGVDDQRTRAIRIDPQMDACLFLLVLTDIMVKARGRRRNRR